MPFDQASLPDEIKEQLCLDLLAEFGIDDVRNNPATGELIHGCRVSAYHQDQDRNPTASLNFKKLTFHCFGCDASGGLLWFIATMRGTRTSEARRWLASETGTAGHLQDRANLIRFYDTLYSERHVKPPIPHYSPRVLEPWDYIHPYMTTGAPEYGFSGRQIPVETLNRFRVGWDPDRDRIVLPHFWGEHLVGWQTRRLADDGTPKYLNSPDFPKDRTIYNYDRDAELTVVVESVMSVLKHAHALHLEATFGASLTDEQIRLLRGHQGRGKIVLFLDPDEAGWLATEGSPGNRREKPTPGLMHKLAPCWVVENPYDADPADLPTEVVQELVQQAVPEGAWMRPSTLRPWEDR